MRNTAITHKNGGTDINSFSYTYNAQDQRDSETVTQGDVPGPTQDNKISSEYNNLNQLLASTNPARTYQYDNDGNLTQGYTKDGYQFTAGYDAENRLINLSYNDGIQDHRVEYSYGADRFVRVIQKYVDEVLTEETRLVRDGYLIVQQRDGSNTALRSYVWSSDALGGIGALTAMVQDSQVYYYLFDGRGNVVSVVDESANEVAGYIYDAFGELRSVTGSLEQPFRFSTKYYDAGTGLMDFGYRFYVPDSGRWLTRDPLEFEGGINLYQYVLGNPINFVDPLGLKTWSNCWSNCIIKNRFHPIDTLVTSLGSAYPKKMLPPFRIVRQKQRLTTISSSIGGFFRKSEKWPDLTDKMRSFGRGMSRIATPLFIFEGVYDIGVIAYCAKKCKDTLCSNQ